MNNYHKLTIIVCVCCVAFFIWFMYTYPVWKGAYYSTMIDCNYKQIDNKYIAGSVVVSPLQFETNNTVSEGQNLEQIITIPEGPSLKMNIYYNTNGTIIHELCHINQVQQTRIYPCPLRYFNELECYFTESLNRPLSEEEQEYASNN